MPIVFDDMIANVESNVNFSPIINELILRGRKLNIFIVLILRSYLKVPKTIRLNPTHYPITKVPNKRTLQRIGSVHSSYNEFEIL